MSRCTLNGGSAMQIPVLVEPVANKGFRARSGEPLPLSAEGPTADEAVRRLRELLSNGMVGGTRLVSVDLSAADHPWLRGAGMFKDDPLFDEWQENIAERRRQVDSDPIIP